MHLSSWTLSGPFRWHNGAHSFAPMDSEVLRPVVLSLHDVVLVYRRHDPTYAPGHRFAFTGGWCYFRYIPSTFAKNLSESTLG